MSRSTSMWSSSSSSSSCCSWTRTTLPLAAAAAAPPEPDGAALEGGSRSGGPRDPLAPSYPQAPRPRPPRSPPATPAATPAPPPPPRTGPSWPRLETNRESPESSENFWAGVDLPARRRRAWWAASRVGLFLGPDFWADFSVAAARIFTGEPNRSCRTRHRRAAHASRRVQQRRRKQIL